MIYFRTFSIFWVFAFTKCEKIEENFPETPLIGKGSSRSFDRVFFYPTSVRKIKPLLNFKVRAYSEIVVTNKDSSLPEISVGQATEFKKEQEKLFNPELSSSKEQKETVPEILDDSIKVYQVPEGVIDFNPESISTKLIAEDGTETIQIAHETVTEETLKTITEETDYSLTNEEDDGFQMIYDEKKMEYVLIKKPEKESEKEKEIEQKTTEPWNGGESKEIINNEKDEDEKIDKLLNANISYAEDEVLNFDADSIEFRERKSQKRTYQLAAIDPRFLEKEEFSVSLKADQLENWRERLTNLTLLEERSADEHRDYGSSYILPVLKSVNYDNTSVPLAFNDIPVNVAVAFNFLYLANFDSELMEFSLDVEMEFSWFDIRLVNNYTKPIRIREKEIIEQIWKPDPYIVNSKYAYFHYVSFPNIRMRITPEGLVTYTLRVSSVCSCFMSFCLYPHDRQKCDLRISSIAYSNQFLRFSWHSNPIRFQSKITLPELHITKIKTGECEAIGKLVDSSCLRILFSLERDSARFVIEKYVPSTLAMMFAWVAPYVPYNYEDVRIITPITVLLTLVQMEKGDKEIRTSYLTSIDVWFAAMKSFTVLSLLESLTVLALIKRSRAMTKNAERAANEFERSTFEAEAYRINRLYHRLDSICRFSSPVVFIMFFVYYVLFVAQGNENCVQI